MGSYTDVKNLIISNIKANGQREITGPILQDVLLNMLENSSRVEEITYSDLKALRDGAKLTPSRLYRITDYTCTTSQANTRSAGHQFDIIVTADDESTLNEVARAIKHEDDTYFADCDLNAWQIWYCLDNDTDRFDWADSTNGKGVIYRMIDEFNSDIPYDFKNIQFYRQWDSSTSLWSTISSDNTGIPCYTFSSEGSSSTTSFTDMSLNVSNNAYSNVIKEYISSNKQNLNNNCFFGINCSSNTFGNNCYNNSFGGGCFSTTFGENCFSNTFGNSCYINTFGCGCARNTFIHSCNKNTFGNNCNKNTFGDSCSSNTFGCRCSSNTFRGSCSYNSFGDICSSNSFRVNCFSNTFGDDCSSNTVGDNCSKNTFGDNCSSNSFGYGCSSNTFGDDCSSNTVGDSFSSNTFDVNCSVNTFGDGCKYNSLKNNCSKNTLGNICDHNSFGNSCSFNSFGAVCSNNSFGNDCVNNSFRVSSSTTSSLKNYVYYNHFDDGCSYNVIWNSNTTSSSVRLKNINVNRGVVGKSSSYNMINIDVLNSEQEINVNQVDGVVSISNISDILKKLDKIIELSYAELVTLRDNEQLIPGQQYRIIDYITTTAQENTQSAGHQFDIIVTALDEYTLSEEAQAIQNSNDGYFDGSNLSAWKICYCLDNDTTRFAWAGDNVKVDEIEHKKYDSSKCTIKPELIDGNAFITPFNFESCVWVDGNNDGFAYSDDHIHHDISELIYEWGYFMDENGVNQLCIYKSEAGYYEEEGQPDYGDKYLYRGVVNVDGVEYDYWQKWDEWNSNGNGGLNIHGGDDYVYATTQRIVSNPEAYSATIETEDVYGPGKGVIYRMIDEWNNDIPYDFKNIMFARDWSTIAPDSGLTGTTYCYTFSVFLDGFSEGATASDESVKAKECIESDGEGNFGNNVIRPYQKSGICSLNDIVFITDWSTASVYHYDNTFGNYCYSSTFGSDCYSNTFGDICSSNTFGDSCSFNTFGSSCYSNIFGSSCCGNTFGCWCSSNTFGNDCSYNSFGNYCDHNSFGNYCYSNSLGNDCSCNSFRVSASSTAALKDFAYYNHFDDGCSYNVIWNSDTTSSSVLLKNINVNRGIRGKSSSYNMININTLNQDYEIQVAKNSKGEIKIYCEADLIR